jgi:hypothetical protein
MTNPRRRLQLDEVEIEIAGQGAVVLRWPAQLDLALKIIAGEITIALAAEIVAARQSGQTCPGSGCSARGRRDGGGR